VLTAGTDMAAQASRTGAVVIDWAGSPPRIIYAGIHADDLQVIELCRQVARGGDGWGSTVLSGGRERS
jgi:hypothetical protein